MSETPEDRRERLLATIRAVLGPSDIERHPAAERARARAQAQGLADRVRFELGDAEPLPVKDGSVVAVVCECSFCTFPDKAPSAAELARVLRPGGRVGITDVWVESDRLDEELQGLVGGVAYLADARPISETVSLLEAAGLPVTAIERHDDALAATVDRVEAALRALKTADLPLLRSFNLERGVALAHRAADAVAGCDVG